MTKEDLIDILVPKNQNTERKFFNKVKNSVSALYDMIAGTVTPLADDIIEDSTHRFVTDVQIADWDLKEDSANKGTASGYAELDETGRVPVAQLPAFVDEVIEAANAAALPATGAASAIYVTLDDNKVFRWGGTAYVEISATIALGELSTTAYRGDRGKIAYDHSQVTHDKALVGLGNVDNTSDMDKPVSTAQAAAIALVGGPGVAELDDLNDAKTGGFSTFLGADAGAADDGSNNMSVAVGGNALKSVVTATGNTAVGFRAAENTTGAGNTAIGLYALLDNLGGGYNTAIGWNALANSLNNDNVGIGYGAMPGVTTSAKNVGIGKYAGGDLSEGTGQNVYIGYYASASGVNAGNEIVVGAGTDGKGSNTSVVGDANQTDFYAGQNGQCTAHVGKIEITDAGGNVIVGTEALIMNVSGTYNTAIGAGAMRLGANGHGNTAIGGMSLFACTSSSNTAIGSNSLQGITTGGENTAVGVSAGQYIEGSGTNQTSSNSVYVGRSCKPSADGNINEIIIGHSAIGNGTNTATIGDDNVTDFYAGEDGQAIVHGGAIQTTLIESASLSNPPTLAELSAALGSPGFIGSGHEVNVFDTINSIMYNCNTDGTDWYYVVKTKAL